MFFGKRKRARLATNWCAQSQSCVRPYFHERYSHLRRGGGVEDSKSIDSASEPCYIKEKIISDNRLFASVPLGR